MRDVIREGQREVIDKEDDDDEEEENGHLSY